MFAREVVASRPDAILARSILATAAVLRETRAIPTVFVAVSDPVGDGFVSSALLVTPDATTTVLRSAIISAATRTKLSAIHPFRDFAVDGGLISYGTDVTGQYRKAAVYVDRILRGAKPADLQVRVSGQPQDGKGAWPHHPAVDPRERRRSGRVTCFCHVRSGSFSDLMRSPT
jgi:ABC-type uncharacterized transport system substrate-binding protein